MHQQAKSLYRVIGKKNELDSVVTLYIAKASEPPVPFFIPGQYLTLFHHDPNIPEGKSYSISNAPGDPFLSITVKKMGMFSNYVTTLAIDDTIQASDPYGYFYSERTDSQLVCIAAGISITPIMSMIKYFAENTPERKISLLYTNSFKNAIVFKHELDTITRSNPNITVTFFITKESVSSSDYRQGRISPLTLVQEINQRTANTPIVEYFLCGSIGFVKDMWHGLKCAGISEERIYTEAFFSH